MSLLILFLMQIAILAYALVGGVFLAFSDFIMRSLALSGAGAGTMQVINREVFRWVFMGLFLGLAPLSLVMALYALLTVGGSGGLLIAMAGLVYLVGVFGVTVLRNVPLNNALADLTEGAPETERFWTATYLPRWTFWNSVRAGACTISAALLLLGVWATVQPPIA
ncbi:DUF1772 domain-containing protein [Dinoroseobacter sp. S375]|uniref:anthrone oxygenase family protein n=1 Tax=Dinoroseobacter sp. S375 TaxID=3415136 RepID=UPI003C7DF749